LEAPSLFNSNDTVERGRQPRRAQPWRRE
jgi:hypothetical protein